MRTTSIGTIYSSYISDSGNVLVFNIEVDDPYPKKLTYQCVIEHTNLAVLRIGHEKLAQLCRACHVDRIQDSNELNGKRLFVTWDQDQPDERRRTEILYVKPLPQAVPTVEAPSPRVQPRAVRLLKTALQILWADFARAPLSAVLGILLMAFAIVACYHGDFGIGVMYAALMELVLNSRGKFQRDEDEDEDYE